MKLRNKLILSCAALAACATTMVSTTFAWYTSNTEVTAGTITAQTEQSGASTLLISTSGKAGDWSSTADLSSANGKLIPVAWGTDGKGAKEAGTGLDFYSWDPASSKPSTTKLPTAKNNYIQFDLYFKNQTAESSTLYINQLTVTNTTSNVVAKDLLTTVGLTGIDADKTKTYSIDLLRATDILIFTEAQDGQNADGLTFNNPTHKISLDTEYSHNSAKYNDTLDGGNITANAHEYYNAVTAKTAVTTNPLSTSSIAATGSDLEIASLTKTNIVKATFVVFLNGYDLHCFDACQGQTISLSLGFTTEQAKSLKFAAASAK